MRAAANVRTVIAAVSTSRIPAISPMHPTLVREPFHCPGWVYERKEDGSLAAVI